ncbi:hypothetical protein HOE67_03410 [Candidatus Peregrinibacteria bacterium]|nr:hypothetical protein [Candidatus Peregrinibacteria bacterium]MBT4056133.1 hypothetical protein [Candidatus Peregrinibacteria bacterium]
MKKTLLLLLVSIFSLSTLTACGWITTEAELKESFIEANSELACEIAKDPSLAIDSPDNKDMVKDIFEKHDLPIDDDEEMLELFDKYTHDEEVINAVQTHLEEDCDVQV